MIGKNKKKWIFIGFAAALSFLIAALLLYTVLKTYKGSGEGELISLDGYELFAKDKGEGEPPVIIESGLACTTNQYDDFQKSISKYTRVISYDHLGIGQSMTFLDRVEDKLSLHLTRLFSLNREGIFNTTMKARPRTLSNFAEEFKALIKYKKIKPPYILAGHSMGGFLIRYYTSLFPGEVAGLVFIDAIHEDWLPYMRSHHTSEELQAFNNFWEPEKSNYRGGGLTELSYYNDMAAAISGTQIPPNIPVKMYTGTVVGPWAKKFGYTQEDMQMWAVMQHETIEGVLDAEQIIDNKTGHQFHNENPSLVENGIKELVEKYRLKFGSTSN